MKLIPNHSHALEFHNDDADDFPKYSVCVPGQGSRTKETIITQQKETGACSSRSLAVRAQCLLKPDMGENLD